MDLFIYNDSSQKKENLIGRVPVQVKGTTSKKFNKNYKFMVSVSDLKNYASEGGVIYFVVYIDEERKKEYIYYKALKKVDIFMQLKQAKQKKTIGIKFKTFPEDNKRKSNIIMNFYQDYCKQKSFTESQMITEEVVNNSQKYSISFSVSTFERDQTNITDLILENELSFYAKPVDNNILIPILQNSPECMIVQEHRFIKISVNGKVFYNEILINKIKTQTIVKIGESTSIKLFKN